MPSTHQARPEEKSEALCFYINSSSARRRSEGWLGRKLGRESGWEAEGRSEVVLTWAPRL